MILPITAYGDPVLRKVGEEISQDYPNLQELIDNMFETMYAASGVGLAAPQIGLPLRIFLVDSKQVLKDRDYDEFKDEEGICQEFINARVVERSGDKWAYNEGCLSIPNINEDVSRHGKVRIQYVDRNFQEREEEYDGFTARVILHEYDHIQGVLFTDHIGALRKRMLQRKLDKITRGEVKAKYKMKFPLKKKGR